MKATALATVVERTNPPARTTTDAVWTWNAYDVWLSRVHRPRELAAGSAMSLPSASLRQDVRVER